MAARHLSSRCRRASCSRDPGAEDRRTEDGEKGGKREGEKGQKGERKGGREGGREGGTSQTESVFYPGLSE